MKQGVSTRISFCPTCHITALKRQNTDKRVHCSFGLILSRFCHRFIFNVTRNATGVFRKACAAFNHFRLLLSTHGIAEVQTDIVGSIIDAPHEGASIICNPYWNLAMGESVRI